jgi:DNA repair protein RadC
MRNLGQCDRLREKYKAHGDIALDDQEVLELLLCRSKPKVDATAGARELMDRFGTIAGVLGAPIYLLQEHHTVGRAAAFDLKMIATASQRALKSELRHGRVLASSKAVLDYCRVLMGHERREQLRILFLDNRHALIADEVHGYGTINHTPVYPREVVKRALELAASAIILIHNHPSGDPSPSSADIDMTGAIVAITRLMGIDVHDHIIIGRDRHVSMRSMHLL